MMMQVFHTCSHEMCTFIRQTNCSIRRNSRLHKRKMKITEMTVKNEVNIYQAAVKIFTCNIRKDSLNLRAAFRLLCIFSSFQALSAAR